MHDYLLALGLGFVAGLRTFTAPAAVCWAAHMGRLNLNGSPLAFMDSTVAVAIFTMFALGEYIGDLLPKTPSRTAPGPLIARIISGALCGACLSISANQSWIAGAFLGAVGAVIGAFTGYNVRKKLVETLKVKDAMIAIPEDLVAIALAYVIVIA